MLGSKLLKDYLVNFAKPFIYTTALPFHNLASIKVAYDYMPHAGIDRRRLQSNIKIFEEGFPIRLDSPIKPVAIEGNELARSAASFLQESGLDVRAILSPTVPKGQERLRVIIHSFNSEAEIQKLVLTLKELL